MDSDTGMTCDIIVIFLVLNIYKRIDHAHKTNYPKIIFYCLHKAHLRRSNLRFHQRGENHLCTLSKNTISCWGENTAGQMNDYLKRGARGIITNNPEQLVRLLKSQGKQLAKPEDPIFVATSDVIYK